MQINKIDEYQWKSMKSMNMNENLWSRWISMKIDEINEYQWKSMKSMNINENQGMGYRCCIVVTQPRQGGRLMKQIPFRQQHWKFMNITGNQWNQWISMKIHEYQWNQ